MIARIVAVTAATLLLLVLVPVAIVASDPQGADATGTPPDGIPPVYIPVYKAAAKTYEVNWLLLASIHAQETDFSRAGADHGANGCGAAGPMQFGIVGVAPYHATAPDCGALTGTGAGNTWAHYAAAIRRLAADDRPTGYPLQRDHLAACKGVPRSTGCVYDDLDAITAAAAYLHDLGARTQLDQRAWQAARRYNGAPAYADTVLDRARGWQDSSLVAGGEISLPADAPEAVAGAIAAANEISDRPYLLQHYPTHINNPTYDCSSATSHVLWGAGAFGTAPWTSGQLMHYGKPGPGKWITVYANPDHAFITIAGRRFDTSRYDTGPHRNQSGPRWRQGPRPTASFTHRHPAGL